VENDERSQIVIRQILILGTVIGLVVGSVGWVAAQSGTRGYAPPPVDRSRTGAVASPPSQFKPQRTEPSFEERLWTYLQSAQYRNWAPLPGKTDDAYDGQSPHGDKVKLFVNRTAAGRPAELPFGSILVKENFDATGSKLMAITVMYRTKGYAPDSGDWHWTKYETDGSVSTMKGMRMVGKVNACIECHKTAGGNDFVFANDR
jgi:hypothetical protein